MRCRQSASSCLVLTWSILIGYRMLRLTFPCRCMLLGHHLRGLENRLHLSCVVGLLWRENNSRKNVHSLHLFVLFRFKFVLMFSPFICINNYRSSKNPVRVPHLVIAFTLFHLSLLTGDPIRTCEPEATPRPFVRCNDHLYLLAPCHTLESSLDFPTKPTVFFFSNFVTPAPGGFYHSPKPQPTLIHCNVSLPDSRTVNFYNMKIISHNTNIL